ncbi:GIY-YIG nuclease family protein [Candidatus Woesearchaeota archaeon]|jgi:group I intron endonuclease|nr:GIY-YIG nuclease family protein [Candidatus Woesearchaeota archaeon]
MIIYRAHNEINDKSYIGQTIKTLEDRKKGHCQSAFNGNSNFYFHNALRKYGIENFKWGIICECNSMDELNKMESYYIKEYNTFMDEGTGYNMTTGGFNHIFSEESNKKKGKSLKGRIRSKEHSMNISKGLLGRNLSDEHRKNISKTMFGVTKSEEHCNNISKGLTEKKLTESHRKSISDALMGIPLSKERCRNMSIGRTGMKFSRVECPSCGVVGGINLMHRYHFENCGRIHKQKIDTCPNCDKTGGVTNMKRYHFNNCRSKK